MKTEEMKREFVSGRCIPVRGNDIDTDRIIPARYLKVVSFSGLGEYAFFDERYNSNGDTKPHPFNTEAYKGASVLLVNKNFGCGSSREHAPQALFRSGIKTIVGESFAEIFEGNCRAMGIPAVTVTAIVIEELMSKIEQHPELEIKIDIRSGKIYLENKEYAFTIPDSSKSSLLQGTWDSTASLLTSKEAIISKYKFLPYVGGFV